MNKYLIKTFIFLLICSTIISTVLLQYGGYVDYFYLKFTTPPAKSMIIGDSRSLQGIQPRVLDSLLGDMNYNTPFFNYSFTVAQAAFGPLYNESIRKKLDPNSTNGLFIISVTPWMFGSMKNNDNSKGEFRESGAPPHNMIFVNHNPNYEYLLKNLNYFHFRGVVRKKSKLHKDGWLEEKNLPENQGTFEQWKTIQLKMFEKFNVDFDVSNLRIEYFFYLIELLKQHGEVYIVRTPIDPEIKKMEKQFFLNFEEIIDKAVTEYEVQFFDFSNDLNNRFKTYDGHHLDKFGGRIFSAALADSIQGSFFRKERKRVKNLISSTKYWTK